MNKEVNIHEYQDGLEYKIAVMQAAQGGSPVEIENGHSHWEPYPKGEEVGWDWVNFCYRIAKPKIAEGWNPDNLTEDQVGVKDGWRLLTKEEHEANREVDETQFWDHTDWHPEVDSWYTGNEPLRTKKPPGYYLPRPEAREVAAPKTMHLISEDGGKTWRAE